MNCEPSVVQTGKAGTFGYGATSVQNPSLQGNSKTTYATFQTLTEVAKAYGKATCTVSTCNPFHATPGSFNTKAPFRQQYSTLIRNAFNSTQPEAVRADLLVGPLPCDVR